MQRYTQIYVPGSDDRKSCPCLSAVSSTFQRDLVRVVARPSWCSKPKATKLPHASEAHWPRHADGQAPRPEPHCHRQPSSDAEYGTEKTRGRTREKEERVYRPRSSRNYCMLPPTGSARLDGVDLSGRLLPPYDRPHQVTLISLHRLARLRLNRHCHA
jgi:hypothetical protein